MAGVTTSAPCEARAARPGAGRRWLRVALAVALGAVVLVARPEAAGAHAELTSSEPASGAQLDSAPAQVLLEFTEPVDLAENGVEVLAASGDPIDVPDAENPGGDRSRVAVDLPPLDDGAYVVSWRIISEDSHPISGAFTFAVGDASAADAQGVAGDIEAAAGASGSLGLVFGIDRFLAFGGMVVLVGGIGFLLTLWPAGLDDRRARRVVAVAWWTVFLATAAGVALQAAYARGGTPADAFDLGLVGDELDARVSRIWLVRLGVLLVVAAAAKFVTRPLAQARAAAEATDAASAEGGGAGGGDGAGLASAAPPQVPSEVVGGAALLGLVLLLTVSYAGHAASGRWVPVALVADVVHLAGVSAWLGGLTLLALCVLRPTRVTDTGPQSIAAIDQVVGRFSSVAFVSVVAIVVSGVVQGWRQLGSVSALWDSSYGRLLVVKVVLVAAMLAGAAVSRAWVRSHVGAGSGTGPGPDDEAGTGPASSDGPDDRPAAVLSPGPGAAARGSTRDLTGIRRSVMFEVALAVLVLGVTAGLVESVPGRVGAGAAADADAEPAGGGPYTVEEHGNEVLVLLTVDPTTTGPAEVTVEVQNHDGTPADPEEVTAQLRLPERDLGPIDLTLEDRGGGTYASTGADLAFPGDWELLVKVRTTDIDQDSFSTAFVVR
jgi:copper transport protein